MGRNLILAAGLLTCLIPAAQPADKNSAQPADKNTAQEDRKTVLVEVYLPEDARLFFEGQEMKATGTMRRFLSPPLPPGKYTYTIKAIIPSPNGPRTVTHKIDVRPGDCILIRPETRHRAIGRMKVLIVVYPKFDEADEWFD